MKSKILMLSTLLLIAIGTALGQTINVKGVVYDEMDLPAIGATIRLKSDATKGTQTNMNGEFALTGVPQGAIIVVSSVGYKTQELPAAPNMIIKLVPDSELLDEVIVVAFGTAKKQSFTGAAAVVDSKQLSKVQAPDAIKALEGMVPGLLLSSSSGAPGSTTNIQVRGAGSINASRSPLIILNGAPYDGNINSINPRDIESLSVLKDAASAALYGARGANGVIIINTKGGRKGQLMVEVDGRIGVNQRGVPEYELLSDPGQWYAMRWEELRNSYLYAKENALGLAEANAKASANLINGDEGVGYNIYNVPSTEVITGGENYEGTLNPNAAIKYEDASSFNNWLGALIKPGIRQEYNLSITRGGDDSSTFFSLGYLNDQGYAIKTDFQRISSRLSYNTKLYDWLSFQASSQISFTSGNFGTSTASAFSNVFMFTRNIPPIYPLYLHDGDGKIVRDKDGNPMYDTGVAVPNANGARRFSSNKNIVGETNLNKDTYQRLYLTQNARADIDLSHGFKFNTTFSYGLINSNSNEFRNPIMGDGIGYKGILTKRLNNTTTINWNQVLTYDKKFGDFTMQAMIGHEMYSRKQANVSGEKRKTLDPYSTEFNTYAEMTDLTSGGYTYNVEGYFGQLTADYLDKYYISGSLRRDGSSVFSPKKRWGTFWSLGASWRITQEDFLKDTKWVDNLKLRASVGQQGNDALLDDDGYRMYTPYTNLYQIGSDGTNSSFSSAFMGNPDITWEKNLNVSAGLEFALFNNRLSGELDFFTRKTTDMLFNEPVSKTTGFTFQPKNIGSMRNTGFEFSLTGNVVRSENINLNIGVNGMTYKNTILELPERFKENGLGSGVRILKEGGGLYDIYLVKYAGVNPEDGTTKYIIHDDVASETAGHPVYTEVPYEKYRATLKDRQYIGSAIPKLEGGFFANLNAYGVDLSMQFSYRIGGKMFDRGYESLMSTGGSTNNANAWHKDILNRWTPTNTDTFFPRMQIGNQSLLQTSDMFITDASYLSLRNLTLGYTLPTKWTEKIGVKGVRVYGTADNVFLLSKRIGLDPRTSFSGISSANQAGVIRTITGGLTVTF